jgi:glutamine amidotransferase
MTTISVIDCGSGNVGSVLRMVEKVSGAARRISTAEEVCIAEKIILPGVGRFDHGMRLLLEHDLIEALHFVANEKKTPLLGICLGMQLLFDASEEGELPGLGLIPGRVIRFGSGAPQLKVPHMGWNEVDVRKNNDLIPLCVAEQERQRFYFVHSYHAVCRDSNDVLATVDYGGDVTAAVSRGRVYGTQFHPEKSHSFGMSLMKRFVNL